MSQRNPQNDRYKEGGKKGVTKKSAGSAKPKSTAGSSVYYGSKKSAAKTREDKKKERAERNAKREEELVIQKGREARQDYRYFRNIWIVLIVLACIGVIVSFAAPRVIQEDSAFATLMPIRTQIQAVGLVVGYAALIAAFIVDFRKMRPIRKGEALEKRKMSKKERAHREAEQAAKSQKKSLFSRKKQD